jgi:hypothetical protein
LGNTGNTGATGPQGGLGNTGNTGATGPQGTAGTNGNTGNTGATGPQGGQGNTGNTGATGPQGGLGNTGNTGATGPQGTAGTNGNTGNTGATGPQGTAGTNGNTGNTGATGPQGTAGTNGNTGNTGATGPQGTAGTNGNTGNTGATGPQGTAGTNGNTGNTGATGPQGTAGTNGNTGNTGATGPQGTAGTNGNTGATGPQGSTGPNGNNYWTLNGSNDIYNNNSSGKVGIGTTSPGENLTIAGGNISLTTANSYITAASGLTLQETGDTYGTVKLNMQNRNGVNGAMFEQAGSVDLVDFVFKGLNNQRNIRYENRSQGSYMLAQPEFEIGTPADPTMDIADTGVAIRKGGLSIGNTSTPPSNGLYVLGKVGIATTSPAQALSVNGTIETTGIGGIKFQDGTTQITAASGIAGNTGATGPQGTAGTNGNTGNTGATGPQGTAGTNGNTGNTGATGPQGTAGTNGNTGNTGATGPQGTAGTNGNTGNTGATGPQGTAGTNGNTGNTGATGPQGTAGTNGNTGNTGATGPQGTAGTNGNTGNTGATGPLGNTGNTGPRGLTGPTGPAGTNGTNGNTGNTGATGPAGTNGTNGTNGNTGNTGATGPQGTAGTNGNTGNTGATGPQGSTGPNGNNYWTLNGTNDIYNNNSSGLVGIGTTAALVSRLEITPNPILGDHTTAVIHQSGDMGYGVALVLTTDGRGGGTDNPRLIFDYRNKAKSWGVGGYAMDNSFRFVEDAGDGYWGSGTWGTNRMVILAGGNVGIGNTSPASMLVVSGTIETTGIGGIKFQDGTTQISGVPADASSGQILRSAAAAAPTWSTATYPATAGTAGNILRSDGTNIVSQAIYYSQSSPGDPTGTTDTTGVMMGLAGSVTPARSGKVLIIIDGDITNGTASMGGKIQIRYGTGTAPSNGAALTGTGVGGVCNWMNAGSNVNRGIFSVQYIVSGLSVSTAYWIDLSLARTGATSSTTSIKNITITALEL